MATETTPAANVNPITQRVKGGSTTGIMVTLAINQWGAPAETPKTDRFLAKGIIQDAEIADISKNVQGLETIGDNLYIINNEITTLTTNLATSTLVKEDTKKQIEPRVKTLREMIDSGIDASAHLTTIKTRAPELVEQHLALMRAHYSPAKYPLTSDITEESVNKKVEETTKNVVQLAKTLHTTENHVQSTYDGLRGVLPGTGALTLKPINVLTTPKAEIAEPEVNRPRNE